MIDMRKFSVVRKNPHKDGINVGATFGLKQLFARMQYTKNVSQPSSGRHGLGVSRYAAVRANQTFGESKGCLPGGDEPRNMDKPDAPHKRGHENVSFESVTKIRAMCETSQPGGVSNEPIFKNDIYWSVV